jgi:hypothetical protein
VVRFALVGLLLLAPVVALTPLVWQCVSQPALVVADDESVARRRGTAGVLRSTWLPYARPTAASMRAMSAGSRTPRASAVMHSRSSVRFFTPKTTVATPAMDRA